LFLYLSIASRLKYFSCWLLPIRGEAELSSIYRHRSDKLVKVKTSRCIPLITIYDYSLSRRMAMAVMHHCQYHYACTLCRSSQPPAWQRGRQLNLAPNGSVPANIPICRNKLLMHGLYCIAKAGFTPSGVPVHKKFGAPLI